MRRATAFALNVGLVALTLPTALLLRENLVFDAAKLNSYLPFLVAMLLLFGPVMLGLDETHWHHSTLADPPQPAMAVLFSSLAATLATFTYNRLDGISRMVPVLQALLAAAALIGACTTRKSWFRVTCAPRPLQSALLNQSRNVLLVGLSPRAGFYSTASGRPPEHGERPSLPLELPATSAQGAAEDLHSERHDTAATPNDPSQIGSDTDDTKRPSRAHLPRPRCRQQHGQPLKQAHRSAADVGSKRKTTMATRPFRLPHLVIPVCRTGTLARIMHQTHAQAA